MLSTILKTYKEAELYLHYAHLKTTSYAQHNALGAAYDTISGLNDKLAENIYRVTEDLEIPETFTIGTSIDPEDIRIFLTNLTLDTRLYANHYASKLEIQDIFLEYLQCFNKTIYLFSLA